MKKVLSLLTALLICFGVSACNSDKECNCNCDENKSQTDNTQTPAQTPAPAVTYTFITHRSIGVDISNNTYTYIFQVEIKNTTTEGTYILSRKFEAVSHWTDEKKDGTSIFSTHGAFTHLYMDENLTSEISMSLNVPAGETQLVYVAIESFKKVNNPYGDYKRIYATSIDLLYDSRKLTNISI